MSNAFSNLSVYTVGVSTANGEKNAARYILLTILCISMISQKWVFLNI